MSTFVCMFVPFLSKFNACSSWIRLLRSDSRDLKSSRWLWTVIGRLLAYASVLWPRRAAVRRDLIQMPQSKNAGIELRDGDCRGFSLIIGSFKGLKLKLHEGLLKRFGGMKKSDLSHDTKHPVIFQICSMSLVWPDHIQMHWGKTLRNTMCWAQHEKCFASWVKKGRANRANEGYAQSLKCMSAVGRKLMVLLPKCGWLLASDRSESPGSIFCSHLCMVVKPNIRRCGCSRTCTKYQGVQLESARQMSTGSFLQSPKDFNNNRGVPSSICSYNEPNILQS